MFAVNDRDVVEVNEWLCVQGANRKKAACVQLYEKKSKKSECERAGAGTFTGVPAREL